MPDHYERLIIAVVIATLYGTAALKAAPICTPNMDPLKCGEAQLARIIHEATVFSREMARKVRITYRI
jgi:hypothetical protein